MFCQNCGCKLDENFNYCPQCGKRLKQGIENYNNDDNDTRFWKQGWFGVIMLFLFWPVGIYLLVNSNSKSARIFGNILAGILILGLITALYLSLCEVYKYRVPEIFGGKFL